MADQPTPRTGQLANPRLWAVVMIAAIGVLLGLSAFTFSYAEGMSYFQDDPLACVNCHIMRQQFEAWNRSSHKAVAVCNDCHASHTFPDKWIVKGLNGFNHSLAFTTGNFPDPIRIRPFNIQVAQDNCVECHRTLIDPVHDKERACTACHGNVGHSNR